MACGMFRWISVVFWNMGQADFSDRRDFCYWERGLSKLPSGNRKLPSSVF